MNAVIENMLSRRSVRSYTDRPVEPELLKTILDCGLYAPTGHNSQRTRIFVQQKPETIAALNVIVQRELLAHVLTENDVMASSIARAKTPNYHFMHHAGVLISVAGPRDYSNSMAECAAAVENMLLAAHSLGLGGCWINQPNWFHDVPDLRALFEPLGMRDDEVILASLCVGYTNLQTPPMPPRKDGRLICDMPM